MMRGTHARDDGSFGRSASTQTLKGAALLFVAVIIGIVLLHTAPRATTSFTTAPTPTTVKAHTTGPTSPADTTPTTATVRPASQVHVLVANGAGVLNLGAHVRTQLNGAGYNTDKAAIDAPSSSHLTTSIYYQPGFAAEAQQLATILSLDPTVAVQAMPTPPPVPASSLTGVDVLVIAGQDIAGATQTTSAPGATVASTVAPRTTTTVHHAVTTTPPTTHAPTATTVHTTTTIH